MGDATTETLCRVCRGSLSNVVSGSADKPAFVQLAICLTGLSHLRYNRSPSLSLVPLLGVTNLFDVDGARDVFASL